MQAFLTGGLHMVAGALNIPSKSQIAINSELGLYASAENGILNQITRQQHSR